MRSMKLEGEGISRKTVLEALRAEGVELAAPCGGAGTCGKCRVAVKRSGETAALDGADAPDGSAASNGEEVLACQTAAEAGMEVFWEESETDLADMDVSMSGVGCACVHGTDDEDGLGLSYDIGTTTIVCRLVDLSSGNALADAGMANPQRAFGADVISRISAAMAGHLDELADAVNDAICSLAFEVLADAGRSPEEVARIALCGNTVMEHLAGGIDPAPIGTTPFTPPERFGRMWPLSAFGGGSWRVRDAFFAPCVAGYVGGDITADIAAGALVGCDDPVLLVDLGTNGEMALGSKTGVITCATAAGPVFEGANIRFGMPAYPGAISRVRLAGGQLEVATVADAPVKGICGTGLIDAVALLLDHGIVDESGLLLEADEVEGDVPEALKERLSACEGMPAFWITPHVAVTQRDVRNIQLAKAAIRAGILTLIEAAGLRARDISRMEVAGGFGCFLDVRNAARIGLLPSELIGVARASGNLAMEGISAALVSGAVREELIAIAQGCRYVELSNSAEFNEAYLDAMEFPEAGCC